MIIKIKDKLVFANNLEAFCFVNKVTGVSKYQFDILDGELVIDLQDEFIERIKALGLYQQFISGAC